MNGTIVLIAGLAAAVSGCTNEERAIRERLEADGCRDIEFTRTQPHYQLRFSAWCGALVCFGEASVEGGFGRTHVRYTKECTPPVSASGAGVDAGVKADAGP